jgi:hypothetical protein
MLHNISFENENFCAMDILETPTLEAKRRDSINEHESFTFETPRVSCSLPKALEFVSATCSYEDHNRLLILIHKLFKRMVVDAFIYHKYCKSRSGTVALTLQLELYCPMLGGEDGNYTTIVSYKMKFLWSSLRP